MDRRLERRISLMLKWGTLLSTLALVLSVLLQIFARFFLEKTPPWTEEASRLFFIYATAFAAGLALRDRYYVHLDVFYDKLSAGAKKYINIGSALLVLVLFFLLAFFSISFISAGVMEKSPSMKISMSYAFGSMLVLGGGITFYALLGFLDTIKSEGP